MTREQLAAWQARLYEELLEQGEPRREGLPQPIQELMSQARPEAVETARELAERWCRAQPSEPGGSRS